MLDGRDPSWLAMRLRLVDVNSMPPPSPALVEMAAVVVMTGSVSDNHQENTSAIVNSTVDTREATVVCGFEVGRMASR